MTEKYNGWTTYETYNIALWIENDEGLYNLAREYRHKGYEKFRELLRELEIIETPDKVSYNDSGLDIEELDNMMEELWQQ